MTALLLAAAVGTVPVVQSTPSAQSELKSPDGSIGRRYVHELCRAGYPDWAIEYLERQRGQNRLPSDLAERFELELASCFRAAAESATSLDAADRKLDQAVAALESVLRNPGEDSVRHEAAAGLAEVGVQRAAILLQLASRSESTRRPALWNRARENIQQAIRSLDEVIEKLGNASAESPAASARKKSQSSGSRVIAGGNRSSADLAARSDEAEFQRAYAEFLLAQTYPDAGDSNRKEALVAAGKRFDSIYQRNRTREIGLYSHLWHARAEQQLGNVQTAIDIYDEVLVNSPDSSQRSRREAAATFFAQVEHFRLQAIAQRGQFDRFESESADWLKKNRASRAAPGYQGIAVDLARRLLEANAKLDANAIRRRRTEALRLLGECAAVRSEHQSEAILLLRKARSESSGDVVDLATFDEAMTVGESLASAADFEGAAKAYQRALDLAGDSTAPSRVGEAQYRLAVVEYSNGKLEEAFRRAKSQAESADGLATAPLAAALAVTISLAEYAKKSDEAGYDRLRSAAEYVIRRWPDRAEADDARVAVAQVAIHRGQLDPAVAWLEGVDDRSPKKPLAWFLTAQALRHKAVGEENARRLAAPARNASTVRESLVPAMVAVRKSLELQTLPESALATSTPLLLETTLLAVAIALDMMDKAGCDLIRKPVAELESQPATPLDPVRLRAALAAMEVACRFDDPEFAGRVAALLISRVDGSREHQSALLSCARRLAAAARAEGERKPKFESAAQTLLDKLAAMPQPLQLLEVGEVYLRLDADEKARDVLLKALEHVDSAAETDDRRLRVRMQLARILARERKFGEAVAQVESVESARPTWLEPRLVKGRLLVDWCETDKSRLEQAIQCLGELRRKIASLRPRPPEYFEVVHGLAYCLSLQWRQSGDEQQRQQAVKLLKSTLALSPALSGAEMQAKYRSLLGTLEKPR